MKLDKKVQSGTLLGNSKVKEKNRRQIVIRDVTNFCIWYVYLNIMIVYIIHIIKDWEIVGPKKLWGQIIKKKNGNKIKQRLSTLLWTSFKNTKYKQKRKESI